MDQIDPMHTDPRRVVRLHQPGGEGTLSRPPGEDIEAMNEISRITADPEVCGGRPCIRGLRVRVKDILDLLAHGATVDEILADYPYLVREDITAALQYAAVQIDHPVLHAA